MDDKSKRRRAAFRLWTMLIVVALLALPLGWVAYSLNWIRERREVLPRHIKRPEGSPNPMPAPTMSRRLLWAFGELGTYSLRWDPSSKESIEELRRLFPESKILIYAKADDFHPVREVAPE